MKCGHYRLSIKPTPKLADRLATLENYGSCVLIVLAIYGGFFCLRFI